MAELIKNVPHGETFDLARTIEVVPGQVTSLTLSQTPGAKVTLLAMDAGEGLATHAAGGDALVVALEGEVDIALSGTVHHVCAGQALVMPKGEPHGLKATTPFKMLLVVVL